MHTYLTNDYPERFISMTLLEILPRLSLWTVDRKNTYFDFALEKFNKENT